MLDHVSARPVRVIRIFGLELAAVFVEEIFLAVCTAIAAAVRAIYAKTFEKGNKEFQSNHRKALVTSSYCEYSRECSCRTDPSDVS